MTPEKDNLIDIKRLSADTEYFTNVFKRVEKLISVIFYILSYREHEVLDEQLVRNIKDIAFATHEESLATLRATVSTSAPAIEDFRHTLFELESTLRLATAAGVIPETIAQLLFEQLDLVQRFLKHNYGRAFAPQLDEEVFALLSAKPTDKKLTTTRDQSSEKKATRKKPVRIPEGDISSDAYFVYSQLTDRAERIKTVLEAKPHATIKDIAEIITDVSEKTIQRELNSLIEKGQVAREGERRWSRYSVVK
jgi:DNA-binding transcriptional ArsR family regulator